MADTKPTESVTAEHDPVQRAKDGAPIAKTDIGFAERFAFYHRDKAVFQSDAGVWLVWDSTRWRPDPQLILMRKLAMFTARSIVQEVAALPLDSEQRVPLLKFALHCEQRDRLNAAVGLAASLGMARPLNAFDADPYLFNCANGTIDLKTGDLLPHDRDHFITKISPVEYNASAQDALFSRFLQNVTCGDEDLARYLQRAAGYTLTGLTSEKCLFIVYSEATDTGKSSFVEGLLACMGDYGISVGIETFLESESGNSTARYDLAKLQGIRMASAAESKPGREFDGSCIKRLTGGDTIRAREIHQSSIQFPPTHKLWLCTNYAPSPTDGGDAATWNRLRRVPFNYQIPADQRDPNIKRALETPTSPTCQAMLAWAVQGVSAWLSSRLGSCKVVDNSTAEYREESDPLADFIADCFDLYQDNKTASKDIYDAYLKWCREQQNKYVFSRNRLGRCLRLKGFHDAKDRTGKRYWHGLAPKLLPGEIPNTNEN